MARIIDTVKRYLGYKEAKPIDINEVINTKLEEALNQGRSMAGVNLYSNLDTQVANSLTEQYTEMRELGENLEKAQEIISGQLNGFLSGHTSTPILASWHKCVANIDEEVNRILMTIIAKARDLYKNDALIHRVIKGQMNNIVGEGFSREAVVKNSKGEKDIRTSAWLEKEFDDFCKAANIDVAGKKSLDDICRNHFITLPQNGEILTRKIIDKNINRWGFSLQVLDPTRLDYTSNKGFSNGNAVIMGVECNKYGKPVAYYLKTDFENSSQVERISASEIYHNFIHEYPEQRRSIPWIHAAMMDAKQLAAFTESVMFAARFGANITATIETQPGNEAAFSTGRTQSGQLFRQIDQGQILTLNPGEKLQYHTPPFPTQAVEPFIKVLNRRVSTATVSSYASVTNDYSDSNFSSSRLGENETRQDYRTKQAWYIDAFLQPLFQDWLIHCLSNGKLQNGNRKYTLDDYSILNAMTFKGKTWPYIDPVKDLTADLKEYELGITTLRELAAKHGKDIDDILLERSHEYKTVKDLDIPIKYMVDCELKEAQAKQALEPKVAPTDTTKQVNDTSKEVNSRSLDTSQIIINNIHKAPGIKTIKTPILDEDGLLVKVVEEYVDCDTETNIEDNKEQL